MKDSSVLYIALLTSAAGIVLLLFAVSVQEPLKVEISEISESYIGKSVEVSGIVVDVKEYKSSILILLENKSSIGVFAMKKSLPQNISTGGVLRVRGVVKEYKGVLEISANEFLV